MLADVTNQVQKYWAPVFYKELRSKLMLGSLVSRDYEGEIKRGGDTVYISQLNAPSGQLLTVGTDADSFSPEAISTTRYSVTANRRAVASFEFEDLISLQSQLDMEGSAVRESLLYAMNAQINTYLASLISPSTSAPDHTVASVTDFNASQVANLRKLAATAKWDKTKPWIILADPSYYSDLLNAATLASTEYGATDVPTIGGNIALQRFGFNIYEDDSKSTDTAVAFHPDFMAMVMQRDVQVKISDLHSQNTFGYVISVDVIFGATQIDSKRVITVAN
jgi:hypothetical protein